MEPITSLISSFGGLVFADELVLFSANILAGIATIFLGLWLSNKGASMVRAQNSKFTQIDPTLMPILALVIRYSGFVLTVVVALGQFGIQTTSIIAVLGAAGLAIGLALQGALSNVAAGMMLLLLRPFNIGDWIEASGISGTVREISLFSTQIDTFENIYISVPNSTIWASIITNHSRHKSRRLDLDIGIGYDSDLDVAEQALLSLCEDERILKNPAAVFLVVSYGDSAIVVRLRLYANYSDFFALSWDLNRRLKSVLDAADIEIPFPQRVIHTPKIIGEKKGAANE